MKYILTPVLALILFVVAGGAYTVMLSDVSAHALRAREAKAAVDSLSARSASLRATELLLADTAPARATLASFVAGEDDVARVIAAIETAADDADVTASIATINVNDLSEYHSAIHVSFSTSGSFAELTRLMDALARLPLASRLEAVSLEASSDGWFGAFKISFIKEKP